MEISLLLVGYLILGVIFGIFCYYLADKKGHSGGAWFWLGLFFSFLALLVLIGLPSEPGASREQGGDPWELADSPDSPGSASQKPPSFRQCPHCIQEVHELATACPHCQRGLPEVERCSNTVCNKIINPTDNRCEDDEGNLFCDASHREVEYCSYGDCGKVIEPTDNRCEDVEENPFCSREHRGRERYRIMQLQQEQSIFPRIDRAEAGAAIVVIIVVLGAVLLLLLAVLSGG